MPEETPTERGTCFVVMGFGKKTDFETGRTLDLDKTYRNIIKPAAHDARLQCIRADEIVHSGLIDVPMYEQLLNADVVIADLSTSNKNAFYELGVRHALRPYTTVVIAEDGIKTFPFDVNHVVVRQYHHLGEDIGYDEAVRFRDELTKAINTILDNTEHDSDSPVYTFIHGLTPPALAAAIKAAEAEATKSGNTDVEVVAIEGATNETATAQGASGKAQQAAVDALTHSVLMGRVDEAQQSGDFLTAKALLATIRGLMKASDPNKPDDPTIIQRLALVTYKSKLPTPIQALEDARDLLKTLNPETSNDPETLGLWGAVHKRLWDESKDKSGDRSHLDVAVRACERGFYIRNDCYNGINLAYCLNVRAANAASRAEAIADFVQAERIRREVLAICEPLLESQELAEASKFWVLVTMAQAYLGIGDEQKMQQKLQEAHFAPHAQWMNDSTQEQLAKLRQLLSDSPLKYIMS